MHNAGYRTIDPEKTMTETPAEKWSVAYRALAAEGTEMLWPSETLVRLLRGAYVPDLDREYTGKRCLEVGFGNGTNLVFLGSLGLKLHGTEIDERIVEPVTRKIETAGFATDLRVGHNREIPFPDDHFDVLVSWNVIHYETSESAMAEAIAEHARVLRPGGRFFVSTTGPDHKILVGATRVSPHVYHLAFEGDFRKGDTYFCFETVDYVQRCFSEQFSDVMVGRTHDFLMTDTLDWFVVTGVKP
jgi:SAM-dependent methyltransferase